MHKFMEMDKIQVFKIGGNVVDDREKLGKFAAGFAAVPGPKVLIHGGGAIASQMQKKLGMEPVMIEGRRVTDSDTLRIVTMVYAGWCNKSIVALLQKNGCNAIGLSGADGAVIKAVKRPPVKLGTSGRTVDYGHVGDITPDGVDSGLIDGFLKAGLTPVFCAITCDTEGNLLNTNADTVASAIAVSLMLFVLIYVPCIATIATIKNETGSWWWALFAAGYTVVLAWVVSTCVYQSITHGVWQEVLAWAAVLVAVYFAGRAVCRRVIHPKRAGCGSGCDGCGKRGKC